MGSLKETYMYTIYLYKTHPYRDRIVIRHEKLYEYEYDTENFKFAIKYNNINFNPNDGITAEVTVGKYSKEDDDMRANYLMVTELQEDAPRKIVSRWFVMEQKKIRYGQWRLTLRRDVVADNYDECLKSTFYIEKAMLKEGNSLIYNSEGSVMNKVKVSENLLEDKTKVAWIVGYLAKGTADIKGEVRMNSNDDSSFVSIGTTLEKWKYGPNSFNAASPLVEEPYSERLQIKADRQDGLVKYIDSLTFGKIFSEANPSFSPYENASFFDPDNYLDIDEGNWNNLLSYSKSANASYEKMGGLSQIKNAFGSAYGFSNSTTSSELKSYNGVSIVDTNGKHYRCRLTQAGDIKESIESKVNSDSNKDAFNYLLSLVNGMVYDDGKKVFKNYPSKTDSSFLYGYSSHRYYLVFEELQGFDSYFNMSGSKLVTEDAGYDVFAIPYPLSGEMKAIVRKGNVLVGSSFTITAKNSLALAQSIATVAGTKLYDMQLLPYCPITKGVEYKDINEGGSYKVYKLAINWDELASSESLAVSYAGKSSDSGSTIDKDNLMGIILHCPASQFSFDIDNETMIKEDQENPTALRVKESNECDMYRLVSPNYQGTFEFSLSKNGFYVRDFHVDCKYKPYSPYIHVSPDFQGLYGTDYNDARGLTCSGDFSLDVVSDAWIQYQINNKNYENVFNRQIEYLDFNRGQERIAQAFSLGAGAVQGTTTGGLAGMMVGGPMGALAGATAGSVSSIAGGLADWAMSEERYRQQRQYNSDMYQFRLGNVQALPYTLTKISSLNPNSKLVPFVEKYSCTSEEREAFAKKIKYNSMSVGAIGFLGDYVQSERTFVKGQLIRYGGLNLDDHEAEELTKEFNMGVYI